MSGGLERLGLTPFSDGVFTAFRNGFDALAREAASHSTGGALSGNEALPDLLRRFDAKSLQRLLFAAGAPLFPRGLPQDRLGDAVFGYGQFVLKHRRPPLEELRLNDVLHHIKTSDEILNPLRVLITDKELAKSHIKAKVGAEYVVPTLEVLRSDADIDAIAPDRDCCLKPTHSSARALFHRAGETLDRGTLKDWLRHNYYPVYREANYRYLRPKVIVEPLLFETHEAVDYKVFCVNGEPRMVKVDFDRHTGHLRKMYDTDWHPLPFSWNAPVTDRDVPRPSRLDEMFEVARTLSANLCFLRVDFYIVGDRLLVGELTNCDGAATNVFYPPEGEAFADELFFGHLPESDVARPWWAEPVALEDGEAPLLD